MCIYSARHFITSLFFFFSYCSSRCSIGHHQRDSCKLITAEESPQLNKHIQARNGPRLLLWVWTPLVCYVSCYLHLLSRPSFQLNYDQNLKIRE